MVRKNEYEEESKESEEPKKEVPTQLVTENQLINAKLDHIIAILEK